MKREAVAILQARMRSQRLPGKMLAEISASPLLWHVIARARTSHSLEKVVVATTDSDSDDAIVEFCRANGVLYYRGSEDDVLDRFYQAALQYQASAVVRITGDCPMIDPAVIDRIVEAYDTEECDYASNLGRLDDAGHFIGRTFPDGLDVEAFSFETLERTWHEASLPSEREHVTPHIYKNPSKFRICHVTQERDLSTLRWTVDEPEDLEFVRRIFEHLYDPERHFTTDDILSLFKHHPELGQVNAGFEINEGYRESIRKDRLTARSDVQEDA